jgi:uncharacterized protein (TIGR04562 family)
MANSHLKRPEYIDRYYFDWDLLDVVLSGVSAMDSDFFIHTGFGEETVKRFLKGYGLAPSNPVAMAELFGAFQESLQFIKRYFLKEGNPLGLDLKVPLELYSITDLSELFLMATGSKEGTSEETRLWAEAVLKVMHVVVHIDKDIRSNYFSIIQTQILDKIYKNIYRDEQDQLFLGTKEDKFQIPLVDFATKSAKSRDSMIIKLLHKPGNVSEEIFDRVGVRFVTRNKFDVLNVIKFLLDHYIIIPHNIVSIRSLNTLLDLPRFRLEYRKLIRQAYRNEWSEEEFYNQAIELAKQVETQDVLEWEKHNHHTSKAYRSIQFTARQLINYHNPFSTEFRKVRDLAKQKVDEENDSSELAKAILKLDISTINRDVHFFYPYEVQIVDAESHHINSEGQASHKLYKRSQKQSAMVRVFSKLMTYKGIKPEDVEGLTIPYQE